MSRYYRLYNKTKTDPIGTVIECSKCNEMFEKHQKHGRVCRTCKNKQQRAVRSQTRNHTTKKYEKTKKGFLMRTYRNMKSRVTGVQWRKSHLYLGLELLEKEEFYEWSLNNPDFHELFEAWEKSGYQQRLSPSIDRIHPGAGYYTLNMEWVTHSENSRRGAVSRHNGKII